jgi:putative colanic acid biosynthesis acetyltransferase WcaF
MRQTDAYASPWSVGTRLRVFLWGAVWVTLFRPTPKPLYPWRIFLLRCFGCKVKGRPFVSQSAIIKMPWNLVLGDRTCLAPKSEIYNLGPVILGSRSTISQQAYLCGGTHDFSDVKLPLVVGTIEVGEDAFIGARAFVNPGVAIGRGAIIGACSVVTKDMPAWTVCVGNPCRPIKARAWHKNGAEAVRDESVL